MRYFYEDDVAMQWMSKHFGMRFESQTRLNEKGTNIVVVTDKWYIMPESLHLLEPLDGDIMECCGQPTRNFNGVITRHKKKRGDKIIWRNNLAFIWPEREE